MKMDTINLDKREHTKERIKEKRSGDEGSLRPRGTFPPRQLQQRERHYTG